MARVERVGKARAARRDNSAVVVRSPKVSRTFARPLRVGAATDAAEREADRIADEVLARLHSDTAPDQQDQAVAPASRSVDRVASDSDHDGPVVGRAGGPLADDVSARIDRARAGGMPLRGAVRERMETAFGSDFGTVRIHHDVESAHLNRLVSARAFTTGQDIFFGEGEFRPDTDDGERVLAHELAHTRQHGAVHRDSVHRFWDFDADQLDWNKTRSISTLSSGQAIFFYTDSDDDKIVIKSEDSPIGLAELSGVLHTKTANVKSVRHRKLSAGDSQTVNGQISDPEHRLLDARSWGKLGGIKRTVPWIKQDLGDQLDNMDDVAVAQYFHGEQLKALRGVPLMAMTFAQGDTAAGKAAEDTFGSGATEKTGMRHLLMQPKHVENLGEMTAVDLFMGNNDRVYGGNLGNWIYDPAGTTVTTIDHVDANVQSHMRGARSLDPNKIAELLSPLAKSKLANTATDALKKLAIGMNDPKFGGDATIDQWLDANGGARRKKIEAGLLKGLRDGRKRLIKTFGTTKFALFSKKTHKAKKAIRNAAREAKDVDETDVDYYQVLKARVAWLKKN